MDKTFTRKIIELDITLAKGLFSSGGSRKIIRGLPCEVTIDKPGPPNTNKASIQITGLSYEDMDKLTTLAFKPLESQHNLITVLAGEEGQGAPSVAFAGEISSATADFNSAPDVPMSIEASSGEYPTQIAHDPLSVHDEAPAADLIAQFAAAAGYDFVNEGFTGALRNTLFTGSPLQKAKQAAREAGADLIIDDGAMILMPMNGSRRGDPVLLAPRTGLIGYPTFDQDGISCRCLYNPALRHNGLIRVESSSPHASGLWVISRLSHNLSAFSPNGGQWESNFNATPAEEQVSTI